jgi:hypothetical protein
VSQTAMSDTKTSSLGKRSSNGEAYTSDNEEIGRMDRGADPAGRAGSKSEAELNAQSLSPEALRRLRRCGKKSSHHP